ncbi:MAG: S8 family serine peptidase [Bacteroidia bacterium]|nr:S8 family serine peptidase [Bacteroidia bacterium]
MKKFGYKLFQLVFLFLLNTHLAAQTSLPDRLLLKKEGREETTVMRQLRESYVLLSTDPVSGLEVWKKSSEADRQAVADLRAKIDAENVSYLESDALFFTSFIPNDPDFSYQWGFQNVGQDGGKPGADIHAVGAWENQTGSDTITAAIIDTGTDWQHPDLVENIWQNLGEDTDGDGHVLEQIGGVWVFDPGDVDGIDSDGNGYIDDFIGWDFANNDNDPSDDHVFGHGTHVAGTVGAKGNNGLGVSGVSWHSKLMILKFLNQEGTGYASDAIFALNYAVAMGAQVSNNSWGGPIYNSFLENAISQANTAGHLFVTAAGNNFGNNNDQYPVFPAAFNLNNILTVTATDLQDQLAIFANIGPTTVDIAAPGFAIYSTLPGGSYGYLSGTSMAAPFGTGAACLLLSSQPESSPLEIIQRIIRSADPLESLRGKMVSGARINVGSAVAKPVLFQQVFGNGISGHSASVQIQKNRLYLSGKEGSEVFISCLDKQGNWSWGKKQHLPGSEPILLLAEVSGGIFSGVTVSVSGNKQILLTQIDTLGNIVWEQILGGSGDDRIKAMSKDAAGNLWVGAASTSFGMSSGGILLLKLNPVGGQLVSLKLEIPFEIKTLKPGPGGGIMIAGDFLSSGMPLPGIISLDSTGQLLWNRGWNMANFSDVKVQGLALSEETDGDPMALFYGLVDSTQAWFVRLDDEGDVVYASTIMLPEPTEVLRVAGHREGWRVVSGSNGGQNFYGSMMSDQGKIIRSEWYKTDSSGLYIRDFDQPLDAHGYFWGTKDSLFFVAAIDPSGKAACNQDTVPVSPENLFWPGETSMSLSIASVILTGNSSSSVWSTFNAPVTQLCENSSCEVSAFFSPDKSVVCEGGDIYLTNQSAQALTYEWRANGQLFSTLENPVYSAQSDGLVEISLKAFNGSCTDEISLFVTVQDDIIPLLHDTVHCGNSLLLHAGVEAAIYSWTDSSGQEIGTAESHLFSFSGVFELEITDACGEQESISFKVTLEQGCLWPGDVNVDGEVNMLDFLMLGLTDGLSGPPRPNPSTQFISQQSADWPGSFPIQNPWASGVNHKHADCDGDGQIDIQADGQIVKQNVTEPSRPPAESVASTLSLTLTANQQSVSVGDSISFALFLDNPSGGLVPNAYGLSLSLYYNLPIKFAPSVDISNSWISGSSPSAEVLTINYASQNRFDLGITRTGNQNISGTGLVANMCCITIVIDDIGNYGALNAPQAFLSVNVDNVFLISEDGTRIPVNKINAQGTQNIVIKIPRTQLGLRLGLQGPFDENTGKMRTNLVQTGFLPDSVPYTDVSVSPLTSHSPREVDWVKVELRDKSDPSITVAAAAGLLMEDGKVVNPANRSLLDFSVEPDSYYVAVFHRNHLPVMSREPLGFNSESETLYNFTLSDQKAMGSGAQVLVGGKWLLWAGDINQDRKIIYSGPQNDRREILDRLGGADVQATVSGYHAQDVNMDGMVSYTGANNDTDIILQNLDSSDKTSIKKSYVP